MKQPQETLSADTRLGGNCNHQTGSVITIKVVSHPHAHLNPWVLPLFPHQQAPFNPFPANDALRCHEAFSFMMSHPAMSLGDRFCDSRKGETGGGGWVHPEGANSMAVSGLRDRKVLVGTGRAFPPFFCHKWT